MYSIGAMEIAIYTHSLQDEQSYCHGTMWLKNTGSHDHTVVVSSYTTNTCNRFYISYLEWYVVCKHGGQQLVNYMDILK